jgi:hypothetical protein
VADFAALPAVEAGAPMPSAHAIATGDKAARDAAQWGSERLLERMLAYYRRHHPAAGAQG